MSQAAENSANDPLAGPAPILIAGPTASGKSALALSLAERIGGVVINADSMQVYSELEILTARPTAADLARAPHALYGFVSARDAYSVGRFVVDARRAIEDAAARGLRPIFVGGTGLYFKALLDGLAPVPPVAESIRSHWRAEAERLGARQLHAHLAEKDPEMAARLRPSDTQRIVRALEVLDSSGRSLAVWQEMREPPLIDEARTIRFALAPARAELHARVDARFDQMIALGALDEAARLDAMQLAVDLPAMRAIGVAPLIAAVNRKLPLEAAIGEAKAQTRQYIKRQETWLKRNMISWTNVKTKEKEKITEDCLILIQRRY